MPTINVGFDNNSPQHVDKVTGKIAAGRTIPYASISEALVGIPSAFRHVGKTCLIDDGTGMAEYWFFGGITDGSLVPKTTAGGAGGDLDDATEIVL